MKTFKFLGAACAAVILCGSAANAQVAETPVAELNGDCWTTITPQKFSANGKDFLTVGDPESRTITLMDEELNEIKTFNYPSMGTKQGSIRYKALPELQEGNDGERNYLGSGFDRPGAHKYLLENYGYFLHGETVDGAYRWVYEYFWEWEWGMNFPCRYAELTKEGDLFWVRKDYTGNVIGFTDTWLYDWGDLYNRQLDPIDFEVYSGATRDQEFTVTQGLFTEDGDYVYAMVFPHYDKPEIVYGEEGINGKPAYKTESYGYGESVFMLYNDKGVKIQSVTLPSPYVQLYLLGDKRYLRCDDKFYAIDSKNAALREVTMPAGVNISPRAMRRSTPVRVELADGKGERTVTVRNAMGASVWSRKAGAEAASMEISTSSFAPGVYVVTVNDGTRTVENCKIVVK